MTEHEAKMVALLDQGAKDAEVALADLHALWKREDEATAANRKAILAAHEQGAKDRAAARKRYTADDDAAAALKAEEDKARTAREAQIREEATAEANKMAAAREEQARAKAAAEAAKPDPVKPADALAQAGIAPRASSLPVTPLAALDQGERDG